MKSLASWLFTIFAIMFWLFRVAVIVADSVGGNLGFPIPNAGYELILLFVTLPCFILIVKRVPFGGLIYFITYLLYFGVDIYKAIMQIIGGENIPISSYLGLMISVMAVALSFAVLADLVFNKNRANNLGDKKTDWFFKNSDYDRKLDERADKNNYKIM